jgi:hypothetical protein
MTQMFSHSNPIPMFDTNGLLPPFIGNDETTSQRSPYDATIVQFVDRFAFSLERVKLLSGLLEYRRLLSNLGYISGYQYLNGSFSQDIEAQESRPPKDIDVFSLLVRPEKYKNDDKLWGSEGIDEWADEIVNLKKNKIRFFTDTYAISDDDFSLECVMRNVVYWYSLFSHTRNTKDWKGFVIVPLSSSDDEAAEGMLETKRLQLVER